MNTSWTELKEFVINRSLSVQWVDRDRFYFLEATDGQLRKACKIKKSDPVNDDQADFEANYKTAGNKALPIQAQPFASKILPNGKKLYKREHGVQQALSSGVNYINFTIPYAWAKIVGVEILWAEKLDKCDLFILDTASGTYSTIPNYPLNQFGYGVNIAEDYYEEQNAYDADLYYGMQISIVYYSQSAKTVGLNFNLSEVKT